MKIILIDESVVECQAAAVDDGFIITDDGMEIPVDTIDRFED